MSLNKSKVEAIASDIVAALKAVEKKHHVHITDAGGRFDSNIANLKLKIVTIGDEGEVFDELAEDFRRYATVWDLEEDDIGRYFTSGGTRYKIVGAKPRNKKYPIIAEGPKGGRYKFPADTVARTIQR
jgi:hypothetical protein